MYIIFLFYRELRNGVTLFDEHSNEMGISKKAAVVGISTVILSRIAMAIPGMSTSPGHPCAQKCNNLRYLRYSQFQHWHRCWWMSSKRGDSWLNTRDPTLPSKRSSAASCWFSPRPLAAPSSSSERTSKWIAWSRRSATALGRSVRNWKLSGSTRDCEALCHLRA